MNRRGFFSALAGGTPALAIPSAIRPKPLIATQYDNAVCECGYMLVRVRDPGLSIRGRAGGYLKCCNPNCSRRGQRFKEPTILLEPA